MTQTNHDPRELREDANAVIRTLNDPPAFTDIRDRAAARGLADCILAHVREDDGEAITREWLGTVAKIEPGSLDRDYRIRNGHKWLGVYFHPDGDVCMSMSDGMMQCAIPSELIPTTRGQFRELCRGLGIEVPDVPNLPG